VTEDFVPLIPRNGLQLLSHYCKKPSLIHELGLKLSFSAKIFSFLHHSKKKKLSTEDAFLSPPTTDYTHEHIKSPSETIWIQIHAKNTIPKQKIQHGISGIRKICQIKFFRNSRKPSRMHEFCSKRLFRAIPPPAWFFKTSKKSCSDRGLNPSIGQSVKRSLGHNSKREQTAAFYHI